MSFRTEEKIIIQLSEIDKIKSLIYNYGGIKIFPKRKISSLYFDNTKLKMHLDSEEGCVPRKKIRVRHYPDSKQLDNFNLETKISSVEGRYKKSNTINKKEFRKICDEGFFDLDYGNCYPQIWIEYLREYLLLKNQRITLDYNIKINSYKSKIAFTNYENLIIEIKGNKKFNKDFFDNLLPYPRSRFSKYSDGIKKISTRNITD